MTTCSSCWAVPWPRRKRSYLIHLVDEQSGRWGRCVFQSECEHGMQEWAQQLADEGMLHVHDYTTEEKFLMTHPRVIHVDSEAVKHLPIVDPDPV